MNPDAEKEAERLANLSQSADRGGSVNRPFMLRLDAIRWAMQWAYSDSAKICKECSEVIGEYRVGYIVRAIEASARGERS